MRKGGKCGGVKGKGYIGDMREWVSREEDGKVEHRGRQGKGRKERGGRRKGEESGESESFAVDSTSAFREASRCHEASENDSLKGKNSAPLTASNLTTL